jgi:hypothetical protein
MESKASLLITEADHTRSYSLLDAKLTEKPSRKNLVLKSPTKAKVVAVKQGLPKVPITSNFENKALLDQKADISDLIALNDLKSNKFDTEKLMQCIDIEHK